MTYSRVLFPLVVGALSFPLVGCLVTREELRGGASGAGVQQQQVEMQRQEQVLAVPSNEQYDEQIKTLRNRIDVLEYQLSQTQANPASEDPEKQQAQERRLQLYEEALKSMETQLQSVTSELQELKKKALDKAASSTPQNGFQKGETLFGQKKWREAILSYQEYRDRNPKGANYSEATYKIGVCFQELQMKNEARVFFQEVVTKLPGSPAAKKASYRLSQLGK